MPPSPSILEQSTLLSEQLRAWRRHLHAHPELSGREENTAAFVAQELRDIGYEVTRDVGGTFGLTAELLGGAGPAVALRADIDALPIVEENDLPYASKNPGAMHACGHDAHTAMLLGAARLLRANRERLKRPARLIFQPAEEVFPGGAAPMIAAGVLDGVGSIFGLHISSQLPVGSLGTRMGPFMAGLNDLKITIQGKGGHAAMPEQCVDPIVVAAHVITALQTVTSRSLAMTDAAVVSVTRLEAGTADNIIPEQVRLTGTIRTYDESVRARVLARVREIVGGVTAAFGATAEIGLEPGYPVLVNHAGPTQAALAAARSLGFDDSRLIELERQGGGEDFAYYCQKVPGAFAFLGARNDATGCCYPHHHPRFNIDEDALPLGAALLAQYALASGCE